MSHLIHISQIYITITLSPSTSRYLHSVGVMDYSLLMGVHYTKYAVNHDVEVDQDDDDDHFTRPSVLGGDDTFDNSGGAGKALKRYVCLCGI